MPQLDLEGNSVPDPIEEEIIECEWCNNTSETIEMFGVEVFYDPWETEGHIIQLCDECYEYMYQSYEFCEHCGRTIATDNGRRKYIRYYEDLEIICVGCLQDLWFKEGIPRNVFKDVESDKLDGDFFNYADLEEHGFHKIESYSYGHGYSSFHGYSDIKKCKLKALELIDSGHIVIIDIEASGMGLGGYFGLWAKKVE